ncbi:MAG TPA: phage tail sheath subtilisin-like domain-containing protein [Aggregatilineales bacterium]|nr:phage tail sheath family protein [Chloroflexota bacterium]HOA24211.1 phage tail sheath subtilisin-like domain-containing protein [Aggregatilineales bacterium]HPV06839.1 phage tail sheath subtilisin-like domain-containing protein [Aggregatilineales bacterium]HQA66756.1 phage tail sheath subtilisin-like domain-containing protein [Aggregatilineales bacterium]
MAVQVSYPGVYIQEFAPGAPIQGVGTSTAAFIGPASSGPLDRPTRITSWDQFLATFGERPISNSFFLWYAVRGFFENGGTTCYVVRASNGSYAELNLANFNGDDIAIVRARQPGSPTTPVQVAVSRTTPLSGVPLYQPTGSYSAIADRTLTVTDADEAAQFRPGDILDIEGQRATLARVSGDQLTIAESLSAPPATGTVRLADATAGTRTFRVDASGGITPDALAPGTVVTLTQGGTSVTGVIEVTRREPSNITAVPETYRITLRDGLTTPVSLDPANPATLQTEAFDITVSQGSASQTYANLSIDPAHPRYFVDVINEQEELVEIEVIEPPPMATPPGNLPDNLSATALAGGSDEDLSTLNQNDYIDALNTLQAIDDVNLVAIPDAVSLDAAPCAAVQQAIIAHCELMADRFGVLDARPGLEPFGANGAEGQRQGLDSTRGYAAYYYPWLRVFPAGTGGPILVPPSGHVCGIMARIDQSRGVHKAPAGNEATVNGAVGVQRTMSDTDQGLLNLQNINVIRVFNGGRPVVWGARTTATDTNWQYINIRRLFLFLEESIQEGLRGTLFEPNNRQLWQKVKRTITEFLSRVWRDGALFGSTPEEAFYVRIDDVLNPFSEQALGRLNIEIGVRPSYTAEFIIVRIGIWAGGSEVSEG